MKLIMFSVLSASFMLSANVYAQRPPPQQAFDACLQAEEGDYCEVKNTPQGDLAGRCVVSPRESKLLCKADRAKPEQSRHGSSLDFEDRGRDY